MSKIMQGITGGSKSSGEQNSASTSFNRSFDPITSQFAPMLGNAGNGANALWELLNGGRSGFDAYKGATGYDFALDRGLGAETAKRAATGSLNSGAALKSLQAFGSNLNDQYANSYMDNLLNQANLGFQAGNQLASVGDYSTSNSTGTQSSSTKKGIGGMLGKAATAIAASDYRLKENIKLLYTRPDGLNVYEYDYKPGFGLPSGRQVGVMADEVRNLLPDALGPEWNGYMTVDYSKIGEVYAA